MNAIFPKQPKHPAPVHYYSVSRPRLKLFRRHFVRLTAVSIHDTIISTHRNRIILKSRYYTAQDWLEAHHPDLRGTFDDIVWALHILPWGSSFTKVIT